MAFQAWTLSKPLGLELPTPTNYAQISRFREELDEGESSALALAVELKADAVLIDERRGYRIAQELGLNPTGLLGILLLAKHETIIPAVKPFLDRLISEAGFWISDAVYQMIMDKAGEQ